MYDTVSAAEFMDHSQPLLLRRHNVVPGMFLVSLHCITLLDQRLGDVFHYSYRVPTGLESHEKP